MNNSSYSGQLPIFVFEVAREVVFPDLGVVAMEV